jgi:hypothetical protein
MTNTPKPNLGMLKIVIDSAVMDQQLAGFEQLIAELGVKPSYARYRSLVEEVEKDIVLGERVTTILADGTRQILQSIRFGESFDRFTSALRADNTTDPHGASLIG